MRAPYFSASSAIRYIALYVDGKLDSRTREGLANAGAAESNKYEELIVDPTLMRGQGPAQDPRCAALGKRLMSTPTSAMSEAAAVSRTPGIVIRSSNWARKGSSSFAICHGVPTAHGGPS